MGNGVSTPAADDKVKAHPIPDELDYDAGCKVVEELHELKTDEEKQAAKDVLASKWAKEGEQYAKVSKDDFVKAYADHYAAPAEEAQATEAAAPADGEKPAEEAQATEAAAPAEGEKPAEEAQATEAAAPAEGEKPAEEAQATEAAAPAEEAQATEAAAPAEEAQATEAAAPAEEAQEASA